MRNIKVKISDEAADIIERYMEEQDIVNTGEAASDIVCEWNQSSRKAIEPECDNCCCTYPCPGSIGGDRYTEKEGEELCRFYFRPHEWQSYDYINGSWYKRKEV